MILDLNFFFIMLYLKNLFYNIFLNYKYIGLESNDQLRYYFENKFFISFLLIFGAMNLSINQYFKSEKIHIKKIFQK